MRSRLGISLVETVIAMSVAGILMAVAVPRFATVRADGAVRSAQSRVVSALATARASAIQRNGTTSVKWSGNRVSVVVSTGSISLGQPIPLDTLYTVSLSTSPAGLTQVDYDSRGFASNLTSAGAKFILTRSGATADTICVTRLGVVRRTCETL